jgi:hypothetical protein
MIPVSECRRRSQNEYPWPARSGATPALIAGAEALATENAPYKFSNE